MFARGESADRVEQIGARDLLRFDRCFSGYQLRQYRTADERWRTAVCEIARDLDPFVANNE